MTIQFIYILIPTTQRFDDCNRPMEMAQILTTHSIMAGMDSLNSLRFTKRVMHAMVQFESIDFLYSFSNAIKFLRTEVM